MKVADLQDNKDNPKSGYWYTVYGFLIFNTLSIFGWYSLRQDSFAGFGGELFGSVALSFVRWGVFIEPMNSILSAIFRRCKTPNILGFCSSADYVWWKDMLYGAVVSFVDMAVLGLFLWLFYSRTTWSPTMDDVNVVFLKFLAVITIPTLLSSLLVLMRHKTSAYC